MDTIMQSTLQPPKWRSHHRAAIRRWESESQVEEGGETRGDHQGRVHRRHQNHFQITKSITTPKMLIRGWCCRLLSLLTVQPVILAGIKVGLKMLLANVNLANTRALHATPRAHVFGRINFGDSVKNTIC